MAAGGTPMDQRQPDDVARDAAAGPPREHLADQHWLDHLARSLASGQSRRSALRRIGGSFAGALLAALIPTEIWATDKGSNDKGSRATSTPTPTATPTSTAT